MFRYDSIDEELARYSAESEYRNQFDGDSRVALPYGQNNSRYPPGYHDHDDIDISFSSPSPAGRRASPRSVEPFGQPIQGSDNVENHNDIEDYDDIDQYDPSYYEEIKQQGCLDQHTRSTASHQPFFQRTSYLPPPVAISLVSLPGDRSVGSSFGPRLSHTNIRQVQPANHRHSGSARSSLNLCTETNHFQDRFDFTQRGDNPRNSHGTRLRPVTELPDIYRGIFKFGVFNAVQSACFDTVMYSEKDMVISAPTGSGKTVLFELSIIRMLTEAARSGKGSKCVYMAPTKALCSERYKDWTAKFDPLGFKCCELTGDTVHLGKGTWGDAKAASIIITTGEKWDSLTRNWMEHERILCQIQLFLVDEVHILNESRGSTLEVVISRMKARGSDVRFVLVSATVPNIDDVASWIGGPKNQPARTFEFGEEYRPCKLTRFVYPISKPRGSNDWVFASILDKSLFPILQKHSVDKPILVFCPTRKGCVLTALMLTKEYDAAVKTKGSLPWSQPKHIDHQFQDKALAELAAAGVGVHHAGLHFDDRRATEDLYLKKILRVVVATSTLAVGVNLPAHTVVIKGVKVFQNNVTKEYSDLDVMQMMGRAGRPQFDKDGIAIILCEPELEQKYKALASGTTRLESSLHLHLDEHLNSEIGLGTIINVDSAKEWLRNSFLWWRLQKNPKHYAIGKEEKETWQEKVDDLVMQSIKKLKETELVHYENEGDGDLCSTEYGDIMSKFYIRQSTMSLILKLRQQASLREVLEMLSASDELVDLKIRAGEKAIYDKLRQHRDIRFEIKKVQKTSDKIFLLIQAVLGGISLNSPEYKKGDSQPQLEVFTVFRHITRIACAVVEVAIVKRSGALLKHGSELVRSLNAKAWEDRPVVLRQLDQIGEKSLKALAEHGITCFEGLLKESPYKLETLLNRRAPFGQELLTSARELPQYCLKVSEVHVMPSVGDQEPVEVELSIECSLIADSSVPGVSKQKKQKGRSFNMTTVLTVTSDLEFVDYRRIPTKALKVIKEFKVIASLTKPSQSVSVYIASESIAGVSVSRTYKPDINPNQFPTMNTRPRSTVEIDLIGLEANADFWDMGIDDEGEEIIPIKDLTKRSEASARRESVPKHLNAESSILGALDRIPTKPQKLPNGNYQCNHPCKDKKKCRHMCCRDGLPEAPAPPKKRAATSNEANKSGNKKPSADRLDNTLQQLQARHESATTDPRLKIELLKSDNLTVPSNASQRKPRAPPPDFTLTFADFEAGPPAIHGHLDLVDSDEDLPDIHELMSEPRRAAVHKPPSPVSDYSNSEMDALIRDAPMDDFEKELLSTSTIPSPSFYKTASNRDKATSQRASYRPTSLPAEKETSENKPSTSTNRFTHHTDAFTKTGIASLPLLSKRKRHQEPLFLADLSDGGSQPANAVSPTVLMNVNGSTKETQGDEDYFTLDYSLFDIVPGPNTSTNTKNSSRSQEPLKIPSPAIASSPLKRQRSTYAQPSRNVFQRSRDISSQILNVLPRPVPASASRFSNSNTPAADVPTQPLAEEPVNDALAELEAWLLSDAVIRQ